MSHKEHEKYYLDRVREVLVLKPNAGRVLIKKILQENPENPLVLGEAYVGILKKKILGERRRRYDFVKVEERLAELQDRTEGIVAQLWRIVLDGTADERARVAAAKTIIEADHKFFEAQMNAGVFERKLGTVEVEHSHFLAPEHVALVKTVFKNYGIIKAAGNAALPAPDGNGRGAIIEQPANVAGGGK